MNLLQKRLAYKDELNYTGEEKLLARVITEQKGRYTVETLTGTASAVVKGKMHHDAKSRILTYLPLKMLSFSKIINFIQKKRIAFTATLFVCVTIFNKEGRQGFIKHERSCKHGALLSPTKNKAPCPVRN